MAVLFHMRLTRPILGMLLVVMGLWVILRDQNRNVIISAGMCLVLCAVFFAACTPARCSATRRCCRPRWRRGRRCWCSGPFSLVLFDAVHTLSTSASSSPRPECRGVPLKLGITRPWPSRTRPTRGRRSGQQFHERPHAHRPPPRPGAFQPQVDPLLDRPFHQAAADHLAPPQPRGVPQPVPVAGEVVQHAAPPPPPAAPPPPDRPGAAPALHTRRRSRRPPRPAGPPPATPPTPPLPPAPPARRPPSAPARDTRPAPARAAKNQAMARFQIHSAPSPSTLRPRRAHPQPPRLRRATPPERRRLLDGRHHRPRRRGGQVPLLVSVRRRRRPPLAAGEHRHLHVPPALRRVHLARVDVQLLLARRRGERLRQGRSPGPRPGRRRRLGMGVPPQRFRVHRPAGQLAQQPLGLAKRVVQAGQTGHAAGPHRQPAGHAQEPVGGEADLTARLTAAMPAAQPDRPRWPSTAPGRSAA